MERFVLHPGDRHPRRRPGGRSRHAANRVRDNLAPSVSRADAEQVHDPHRRVLAALDGHTLQAYLDRSGETRSV
ncbi:hypothetical protein GCM10010398_67610 [Streptomyces fimbriatus]